MQGACVLELLYRGLSEGERSCWGTSAWALVSSSYPKRQGLAGVWPATVRSLA